MLARTITGTPVPPALARPAARPAVHRFARRGLYWALGGLVALPLVAGAAGGDGGSDGAATPPTGAGATAAPPLKPDRDLRNTYWKLFELNGRPSTVAERQREPHLILQLQQDRVVGSGGCNRFTGTYALHGDFVRFDRLAATEMACPQGMEQEGEYLATLGRVRSWRVHGEGLALLDERGIVVARFRAVDLR